MAPRCTSGEHHTGVSPLLQPLDGPCLSTGRGALRTSVSACCCHNRCLQHGLGRYIQWAGSLEALDGASTALAHQLPRAAGSASSLAAVSATAVRQACVGPYGQVVPSFLQERLEHRLSPSTLKVYVAAIARCSGRPVPGKA